MTSRPRPVGSLASGLTFPELADRIARDIGWMVFTFNFRGTGGSEGDFSVGGWLADQKMAIDYLSAREEVNGVWLVGTGAGGTLATDTAARDSRVRGVATLGAQATLRGWDTSRFIDHCRRMGVLRDTGGAEGPDGMDQARSPASMQSQRRAASRPARCWCCTALTTTSRHSTTRGCSPRRTGRPSSGS